MGIEQVEAITSKLKPGEIITDPAQKQLIMDAMDQHLNQKRLARGYQSVQVGRRAVASQADGPAPSLALAPNTGQDTLAFFDLRAS